MKNGKTLLALVLSAFMIFALLTLSSLRMTYDDLEQTIDELKEEIIVCEEKISRYESDLSCDMDAAFVERTARERLDLCHTNEIVMEYHLNK